MREALGDLWRNRISHLGLAYESWAPVKPGEGKVPDELRSGWLENLSRTQLPRGYQQMFARWKSSFGAEHSSRTYEGKLLSRLLIGHGNPAATEVGLTLHHTWGTPVIPGSALKGLLSHYIQTRLGPSDPQFHPTSEAYTEDERQRAPYQGVTWSGKGIVHGPGWLYKAIFGAPAAESDKEYKANFPEEKRHLYLGDSQGHVVFYDALLLPEPNAQTPFAPDVLTVHHKNYYDSDGRTFPNDYEDPTPVSFLTVKPGVRFFFALGGPLHLTKIAGDLLIKALADWGVGGKTSLGYGRLELHEVDSPEEAEKRQKQKRLEQEAAERAAAEALAKKEAKESDLYQEFEAWLTENPEGLSKRKLLEGIEERWMDKLLEGDEHEREALWRLISKTIKANAKTKAALEQVKVALVG